MEKQLSIEGQTIKWIRKMTDIEMKAEGWDEENGFTPICIVLSNGIILYASCDPEGNGPGMIFGSDTNSAFTLQ
jgi:hypothetical protein